MKNKKLNSYYKVLFDRKYFTGIKNIEFIVRESSIAPMY